MFKSIDEALKIACNGAIRTKSKKFKEAYKYLEENGYDKEKLEFIPKAKEMGYRQRQIEMCINPDLSMEQYEQLICGMNDGMTVADCELFADGSFTPDQMKQIRQGFLCGLKRKMVAEYANPELTIEEMTVKRQELLSEKYKVDGAEIDKQATDAYKSLKGTSLFGEE